MTTDTGKIDTTEAAWRDLFFKACVALWGERWKAAGAKDLWINKRTLGRIEAGAPVPAYMFRDLRRLLANRGDEVRGLSEALALLMAADDPPRRTAKAPAINVDLIRRRLQDNLVAHGDVDMVEFLLRVLGHDQLADDVGGAMRDYQYYRRIQIEEEEAFRSKNPGVIALLAAEREPPSPNDELLEEAQKAMFVLFREVLILLDIRADEL